MATIQNNTNIEQVQFMLPAVTVDSEFTADELAEDMEGMQMNFPRIKIPSGGSLQFEIPSEDPENPDYSKTLEGIILFNHPNNAYWPAGSDYDDTAIPLCSSVNGKLGIGTPGGSCTGCAMNTFGSAAEGKGKACKNMRALYLLRSGEPMPWLLTLPPTSIKPFRDFMNQAFILRRRAAYGSLVQIGLKKMNNGRDDYSIATFRRLADFSGEELAQVKNYADSFKELVRSTLLQRTAANESQSYDGYGSASPNAAEADVLPANTGRQFYYGQPLDGDREALPA